MPIYLGSTEMKPYKGSSEVSEMYLGSTLVYQNVRTIEMFPDLTVSGEWTPKNGSSRSGSATAHVYEDRITLQGRNNTFSLAYPTNKIDFTRYTKIYVTYTTTVSGGNSNRWFRVKYSETVPTNNSSGTELFVTSSAKSETVEIDISGITGEYYLYVNANAYITDTPRINVTVTNITIE